MPIRPRSPRTPFFVSVAGIAVIGAFQASALSLSMTEPITEDLKIVPADGAGRDDFGFCASVDGGILAVGAWIHDGAGSNAGAAYLYDTTTGFLLHKLTAYASRPDVHFGWSIAIDNDVVAVGAIDDTVNSVHSGTVYLFDAKSGDKLFMLHSPNGSVPDTFGYSIAIDGGLVAVGAIGEDFYGKSSGAVYVFDVESGRLLHTLRASDGSEADHFGCALALQNGILAIGSRYDDDFGRDSGSVYIFDAETGQELRKIHANDGERFDHFGNKIDLDDGVLAVGVQNKEHQGLRSGAGYLFDVATGNLLHKLLPANRAFGEAIGGSVAIDDGIVCLGAWANDDNGNDSGTAYLFDVETGAELSQLMPSDPATQDRFGISSAMGSGVIALGANNNIVDTLSPGSVYLFSAPTAICLADVNGDGMLSPADFTAWINAFNNSLPECDQNEDGACNPADFTAWIANYNAGC